MLKILILHVLLWPLSLQSKLLDLLSTTDQFFQDVHLRENSESDIDAIKSLLRRTYDLEEEKHKIFKRELDYNELLFRDKKGFYSLSNIKDVTRIPVKFPNDINIFSSHNLLYIAGLEANGSSPENQLANDLVLYQYPTIQGIKEIGRVPVLGGIRVDVHTFQNTTYFISAEHEAKIGPYTLQGSTLYQMVEKSGKIFIEKLQILNVEQPNDVKFWDHQDQLYLAFGTNMKNNSTSPTTFIFRWMGHHFDCIQKIRTKEVRSVMPFTIGSFMYLAVANFQDEHGNVDIESEIYKFHLDDMEFKIVQKIKTHGARDWSHFKFEDSKLKKSEHFLIVANSMAKHSGGSLTSLTESVVYKFNNDYFLPFQSFKLYGASQWLPVRGPNDEFLLLGSHAYGVIGYQYDGWRFSKVSLQFEQSPFGENIHSIRAFQYFGDIYLTIGDKSSYGNNINLWKLSFSKKNDLEKQYREIEEWCEDMNSKLEQDGFDELVRKYDYLLDDEENNEEEEEEDKIDSEEEHKEEVSTTEEINEEEDTENEEDEKHKVKKLEVGNLIGRDVEKELRDELEKLGEEAEDLEDVLMEIEEDIESVKSNSEMPIVIGSQEIPHLEVKCKSQNCVTFKNVKIKKLNDIDMEDFLQDSVLLDENLTQSKLEFEHLVVENDLSPLTFNEHPAETLLDTSSETFLNAHIIVNGTVYINGDLNVMGLFDEVVADKDHLFLNETDQEFDETLTVNSLRVDKLQLSGLLNGVPIEHLLRKPEIDLKNDYKELNVNHMRVGGLIGGYNLTELIEEVSKEPENQIIEGDLELNSLEADEVIVKSGQISNVTISDILNSGCLPEADIEPREGTEETFRGASKSIDEEEYTQEAEEDTAEETIIIVEGLLKAKDITDPTNSTSLLDVMTNSYELNETEIDSKFIFSDIEVKDLEVEYVNDDAVDSWVLANSTEVQHVYGKKRFLENIHIQEDIYVKELNGIGLEELERDVIKLDEDQDIPGSWSFGTLTCHEIKTNSTNFGQKLIERIESLEINGSVTADKIWIENLNINGKIDDITWGELLEDSIFDRDEVVYAEKVIDGTIRVKDLTLTGEINDLAFEDFLELNAKETNKVILSRDIKLEEPLTVDELEFEGFVDSVLTSNFHQDWLLTEGPQIITSPVVFENVEMKSGITLMNETVNNINLRRLFTRSLKIDQDTKVKNLRSVGKIKVNRVDVAGTVNGVDFNESVVLSESKTPQVLTGNVFFNRGFSVNGSLVTNGLVSGLNMSHLCGLDVSPEKINLIVIGSVTFENEPTITGKVNGMELAKMLKEVWMKNESATLEGKNLRFTDVEFHNQTTLHGYLNNVNLTHVDKFYMSKSSSRIVSGDYVFKELIIQKWCRMHTATVEGNVNGINITQWAKNVLLQDEDQVIEEKLRFDIFETKDLTLEGTVNGLDFSKDVVRYDVSDAVVEGEKTFQALNIVNLTMAKGKTVQGVDVDFWRENMVLKNEYCVIKGNLTLENPEFYGNFTVSGKVNDLHFDSKHLLLTTGNQVVTGSKIFNPSGTRNGVIKMKSLVVSGPVSGVDLVDLLENQAYSNRNLMFTEPQTFVEGLSADVMEVDGPFMGVNVTEFCEVATHPVDTGDMVQEFDDLLNVTKTLIGVLKGRAFFFDYFEHIQTLRPNIKAVVPTLDDERMYMLAVFTSEFMKFLEWNSFSETFVHSDEGLGLTDNITFVTSEITNKSSLLYIESTKSAKIFQSGQLKQVESVDTSCVAAFDLKPLNKSCIFIGQKWNSSRILCNSLLMSDLQTYQWLESKGSVQVTVLTIVDEVYIAVINKEEVVDKIENTLTIYRFDKKFQHFHITHTLAEVNPVAVSSVTYKNEHYLVSAGGHLPESVHNSVLSIFRFNKLHKVFVRDQSILVDTPVDVHFALLPSPQLALYVLTSNPTKPFVMFLHKGISGFVEETSGLSLYPGSKLYSFTDSHNQHFVVIHGFGKGQILKAGFKGDKST